MALFKIENFGGEIPAIDNRLMPDNHAATSVNTWLLSGRVEPLHALVPIYTCKSMATRSVFRLPIATPSVDNMVNSYWLEFENQNVRVIASPVTGQGEGSRYYWADGSYPKMMTGDMIKAANTVPLVPPYTPYKLGIPQPVTPPGVSPVGGASATVEARAYTYTWVSGLGEEGPPSQPTLASGKIDATWNITVTAPLPADTADRNLTHTRIYRSVTSVQGVASYFLVVELPIATLTYADTLPSSVIVLNEQLPSLDWFPPPADLQGLVSMPNGMVAGWRENEVWFCEPYQPHAWPLKYMIAVPTNIVALGVLGQTVMIMTSGNPWSATGIDPASMALAIIQPLEPCTARLSVVNTPNAVMYCSPNGLINLTAAGAQNLTKDIILKDQWAKMLNLDSVCAAILSQGYYAYSVTLSHVFQADTFQVAETPDAGDQYAFQEQSVFGTRPGILLWFADPRVALTELDPGEVEVQNLITDIFNGEIMTIRQAAGQFPVVSLVDLRAPQDQAKYVWRSKMFKTDYLQNLGAAKVYWTPALGSPPKGDTIFRMYAGADSKEIEDGLKLRFEEKLGVSGQMYRLPSGFKSIYFQFEIEGWAFIDAIHVASSPRELRQV